MDKHTFRRPAIISILTVLCLSIVLAMPLAMSPGVEAATPAPAGNTAGTLAQAAIQNIETLLQDPQTANDPTVVYTAYVLTLAGQSASVVNTVYNGTSISLANYVESSATSIANAANAATDSSVYSAKLIAYEAMSLDRLGDTSLANQLTDVLAQRQMTSGSTSGSFDETIYSDAPALAALGAAGKLSMINEMNASAYLLGAQSTASVADGGGSWGTLYQGTYYPDFLTTAWAIQALSDLPNSTSHAQIQTAIASGLAWMQQQQTVDGSVYAPYDDPVVDTAQTFVTLESFGLNPSTWVTSQGDSPDTYLLNHAMNPDGSFGPYKNLLDAASALQAYLLMGGSGGTVTTTPPVTTSPSSGTTVSFAVVGETGGLLYGPSTVTVGSSDKWGLTVLGALDASGVPYTMSTTYQDFVESIDGEANSGQSGWMYEVNGTVLSVGAGQQAISSGDEIIWWYSTSGLSSSAPNWNNLETSTTVPTSTTVATGSGTSVGASGGTVTYSGLTIDVSAGAFTQPVTVSVTSAPAPDTGPAGFAPAGPAWTIGDGGSQPAKPVQAQFPYSPTALGGLSPLQLGVYGYNRASGTWQWVGGTPDTTSNTVEVTLPGFGTYAVWANTATFSDMSQAPWAQDAVDTLLGADLVTGVAPGVMSPNSTLTRAQFATLLVKADGLALTSTGSTPFADVASGAWYAPYVAAAYTADLVAGTGPTTFDPNAPITRAEMAALLAKLLGPTNSAGSPSVFSDASSVPAWAQTGVNAVVGAGLMSGFPNGAFQPAGLTTRAQAAVVLARYLKYIGKV